MELVDGRLTEDHLKYISEQIAAYQSTYDDLTKYYMGHNAEIYRPTHIEDPDNRIPVPIARKMVSTVKGYAYRPGYISYSTQDEFANNTLQPILEDNDESLLTGELANDVLTYGKGYEVVRMGEDGRTPKLYRIPVNTGYPVRGDTLDEPLLAFVHEVVISDTGATNATKSHVRTVYYEDAYEVFKKSSATNNAWVYDEESSREHPFNMVPVTEYRGNSHRMGIFKPVIPMIDELDKVISGNANERERFAKAYLLTLFNIDTTTEDDNSETDWDKIRRSRLFQDLGAAGDITSVKDAIDFLVKPSRADEVEKDADRLERMIYEMTMIINPNDDEFNSASGIALKYKLLAMEWLCADIDGYFDKGLQRRFKILQFNSPTAQNVTINHKRNIPVDIIDMTKAANEMMGQPIPKEDILRIAYDRSVIADPVATVEQYDEAMTDALPPMTQEDEGE